MSKLEFSSVRHSKYSTMMMLHLLLSPTKDLPDLWPEDP